MKKILSAMTAGVLMMFLVSPAQAGFLFEPYFGFVLSGEVDDGGTDTDDLSGSALGARLGLTTLGFQYGVEYGMGSFTTEDDAGDEMDLDATDIGLFVGFEFPVLVKVWATYNLSAKGSADAGGGNTIDLDGGGYKVGVGYTGLPFVSLNFEMFQTTYDSCTMGVLTEDLCRTLVMGDNDILAKGYMVSVSVPLP